jgi:hypothetical protein
LSRIINYFTVLILIFAMNAFGLVPIGQALMGKLDLAKAFFIDQEGARQSLLTASDLDLELISTNDFNPLLTPEDSVSRLVVLKNNSEQAMRLAIETENASSSGLCLALSLDVMYGPDLVYSGSFGGFSLANIFLATTSEEDLFFEINLTDDSEELKEKQCEFDLKFSAEQNGQPGFSDIEIIKNTVKSGDWSHLANHLVINKVYYDVDLQHGKEGKNEWIELYNPTASSVPLKGWQICNSENCTSIKKKNDLLPYSYALISHDASTWKYWDIPEDIITINHLGGYPFDMDDDNDMLMLIDPEGHYIDMMNWGQRDPFWNNYRGELWEPGAVDVNEGNLLGRVPSGYDTDMTDDFVELALPKVKVLNPNGGEVWWVGHSEVIEWQATNPNGPDDELLIDLFYSRDSGKTWALIASSTENDGFYEFRLPLFLANGAYYTPSSKARVKVVARGPENPMIIGIDKSDEDYCPPIDFCLLTDEEFAIAETIGLVPDHYTCHEDEDVTVQINENIEEEIVVVNDFEEVIETELATSTINIASTSPEIASSSLDIDSFDNEIISSTSIDFSPISSSTEYIQEETTKGIITNINENITISSTTPAIIDDEFENIAQEVE